MKVNKSLLMVLEITLLVFAGLAIGVTANAQQRQKPALSELKAKAEQEMVANIKNIENPSCSSRIDFDKCIRNDKLRPNDEKAKLYIKLYDEHMKTFGDQAHPMSVELANTLERALYFNGARDLSDYSFTRMNEILKEMQKKSAAPVASDSEQMAADRRDLYGQIESHRWLNSIEAERRQDDLAPYPRQVFPIPAKDTGSAALN